MTTDDFESRPPNLQRVMALLYRSGICCGVESNWNSGFTAWLGSAEEAKAILHTDSLEEAATWLDHTAREHYPQSSYVVGRRLS